MMPRDGVRVPWVTGGYREGRGSWKMTLATDAELTSKRSRRRKAPDAIPHWRMRTKVGNGDPGALSGADMRGAVGRQFREVGALLSSDLGGYQHLSHSNCSSAVSAVWFA